MNELKSASQIYKEFQPTLDGQEAVEPEEWVVMAFKAYAEQVLDLASEEAETDGHDSLGYWVDRQSILNLKEQLT